MVVCLLSAEGSTWNLLRKLSCAAVIFVRCIYEKTLHWNNLPSSEKIISACRFLILNFNPICQKNLEEKHSINFDVCNPVHTIESNICKPYFMTKSFVIVFYFFGLYQHWQRYHLVKESIKCLCWDQVWSVSPLSSLYYYTQRQRRV